MGRLWRRLLVFLGVVVAASLALATPAMADCGTIPEYNKTVHHAATYKNVEETIPGKAEVSHDEKRWSKSYPAVTEVKETQARYFRVKPATDEVAHYEAQFYRVVKGHAEEWRFLYQFSRENPGQAEVKYDVYKYKKLIPAKDAEYDTFYQFKRWVDGTPKQCDKQYKYSREVADYKTKYEYVKQVKGVIEKKDSRGQWQTVDTFGYENYWGGNTKWSFDDKAVLESGSHNDTKDIGDGKRKRTTNYQYVKSGKTDQVKTGSHTETSDWRSSAPEGDGWKQIASQEVNCTPATDGYYEYKTENGATRDRGNAGWFKQESFADWKQFNSEKREVSPAESEYWVYKTENGTTKEPDKADWFKKDSFDGWLRYATDTRTEQEYVAPFTEYKTKDGTTKDADKADWFTQSSFAGWSLYGEPKKDITREGVEDQTFYLVELTGDSAQETTVKADAGWIRTDNPALDRSVWTQMGEAVKKIDEPAVPETTWYLKQVEDYFMETPNLAEASWINVEQTFDMNVWTQLGDRRTVTVREGHAGYTEYYVPGGEPTRTLGESNWTTDSPKGWTFVDLRKKIDQVAIPPKVVKHRVLDKKAHDEVVTVPAKKLSCNTTERVIQKGQHNADRLLADTGSSTVALVAIVAGGIALLCGAILLAVQLINRRKSA